MRASRRAREANAPGSVTGGRRAPGSQSLRSERRAPGRSRRHAAPGTASPRCGRARRAARSPPPRPHPRPTSAGRAGTGAHRARGRGPTPCRRRAGRGRSSPRDQRAGPLHRGGFRRRPDPMGWLALARTCCSRPLLAWARPAGILRSLRPRWACIPRFGPGQAAPTHAYFAVSRPVKGFADLLRATHTCRGGGGRCTVLSPFYGRMPTQASRSC